MVISYGSHGTLMHRACSTRIFRSQSVPVITSRGSVLLDDGAARDRNRWLCLEQVGAAPRFCVVALFRTGSSQVSGDWEEAAPRR